MPGASGAPPGQSAPGHPGSRRAEALTRVRRAAPPAEEERLTIALPRTRGDVVQCVELAAAYAAIGVLTLSIPDVSFELRRMIWPASGIALAWVMLSGIRLWPGVVAGAALATALTGGHPLHIAGTAAANVIEIVVAVMLFRRMGLDGRIASRRHLGVFMAVVIGSTALAAIVSVASLAASGGISWGGAPRLWFMWWLTHAMGQVVITPLILSSPGIAGPAPRMPAREAVALMVGLALTLCLSFTPLFPESVHSAPVTFLSFPFLFWAALRCGQFGASSSSFAAAAFAVAGTLMGVGPFVHPSPNTSLLLTILFVSVAECSTLFIASLVAEREWAERERERLERRVHRSQKLESLGSLAGGIAHDFNNLLVAMVGNVDLVLMDTDPSDPAYEPLQQSVRASERATELCRQLLSYAGQGPYEHAVVDLSSVVRDITSLLAVTVPAGTRVDYDLASEPLPVEADTGQLRRVVLNVFTNAGEALGEGKGSISIRSHVGSREDWQSDEGLVFLEPPDGPVAVLEIEDCGEGILPEYREQIFDPGFSTRGPGRGLGLASTLGIVRGHGGSILLASMPGVGTRVAIALPLVDAPIDTVPAPPVPELARHSGKVLVVDDEPAVRQAATALLRRIGYEVLVAEDGDGAIEAVREHGPDLACILLDMTMPGRSGIDVLRDVRSDGRDVPVLLTSGYVLHPIEVLAELGPARFLPKPFTLRALEKAVDELIRETARTR